MNNTVKTIKTNTNAVAINAITQVRVLTEEKKVI